MCEDVVQAYIQVLLLLFAAAAAVDDRVYYMVDASKVHTAYQHITHTHTHTNTTYTQTQHKNERAHNRSKTARIRGEAAASWVSVGAFVGVCVGVC